MDFRKFHKFSSRRYSYFIFWGLLRLDINLIMLIKFGLKVNFFLSLFYLGILIGLWFKDVFFEDMRSQYSDQDGRVYRQGFRLFLFRELILFFTIFWCFFDTALCPVLWFGGTWTPWGLLTPDYLGLNAFASIFLIINRQLLKYSKRFLLINRIKCEFIIFLSLIIGGGFISFQVFEYRHIAFSISDSVYGCIFFRGTGVHGTHVFIGVCFLLTIFFRIKLWHLNWEYLQSFSFIVDYWRFLEWIWGIIFRLFYVWGI